MVKLEAYIPKYPMAPHLELRKKLIDACLGITEHSMCVGAWHSAKLSEVVQEAVVQFVLIIEGCEVERIDRLLREYKGAANQEAVLYTITEVQSITL